MAAEPIPPLKSHEETPRSTPWRFRTRLKVYREFAGKTLGIVAAIFGIALVVHDALQAPQIHVQTAQISAPFSLYFSLHNPSLVFWMNDMQIACVLDNIEFEGPNRIGKVVIMANIQDVSIPPGKTIQYNCPIDKIFAGYEPIQRAEILLDAKFRTMRIERNAYEIFNWNQVSRQWTEGQIIN